MKLIVMKLLCLMLCLVGVFAAGAALEIAPMRDAYDALRQMLPKTETGGVDLRLPGGLLGAIAVIFGGYGFLPRLPRRGGQKLQVSTRQGEATMQLNAVRKELTRLFQTLSAVRAVRVAVALDARKQRLNVNAVVVLEDCVDGGIFPRAQAVEEDVVRLARELVGARSLGIVRVTVKQAMMDVAKAVNLVLEQVAYPCATAEATIPRAALPAPEPTNVDAASASAPEAPLAEEENTVVVGELQTDPECGQTVAWRMDGAQAAVYEDAAPRIMDQQHPDVQALRLLPEWLQQGARPKHGGFLNVVMASMGHALKTLTRRKRLALAALIAFMPVLLPLALAFFSLSQFAESGNVIFVRLVEDLHIDVFCPLLALFFAGMLVAEDIETRTMPYILTRPMSRSAWVLGRFLAYMLVACVVLLASVWLTFAASTAHADLRLDNPTDLLLLAHYSGVVVMGLLAYGGFAVFLGAFTKRPIVYGVILFYGWQHVATFVPGLVDFLTIRKYTDAILPLMATQRNVAEIQTALGTFQREVFLVSASRAVLALALVTLVSLMLTILAVYRREYAADRAAGG